MIPRYSRPEMAHVWSDEERFARWWDVEVAACEAWADVGAVPRDALPALKRARFDPRRVEEHARITHHEMTGFLRAISESVGPEARFVHLGLTSSDVMDTALALQLLSALDLLVEGLDALHEVVARRAQEERYTPIIGRTHGVHAEPTSLGLKFLLWVEELRRHRLRLQQAREVIAVGKLSGAVGSHATVPPAVEEGACRRLGLAVAPVSNQILQRDRHAQLVLTLALLAASLEKFALEVRSLQRTEILEMEEPFEEGQTGSSAMPHKRNPELCERVCGLARVVRGHAVTALENVALWNERDISHSSAERIILPDSFLLLDYTLAIFTSVMRGLVLYRDHMAQNIDRTHGLIFSQRVLLALIERGLSRQEAYAIVQDHAMSAWRNGSDFRSLLTTDSAVRSRLDSAALDQLWDVRYYLRYVDDIFQRSGMPPPAGQESRA